MTVPESVFGGFLVGFGTRLGGGCTSGHGVCGLPRFSIRSFVAVLVFILSAMVVVYIRRTFFMKLILPVIISFFCWVNFCGWIIQYPL